MRLSPLVLILALAGCGSADELPPPEAPPSQAGAVRLDTRARTLTVGGETVDAGAGPTRFIATGKRVYVLDAVGHALLVFETRPDLHLQRRAHLPGRPQRLGLSGDGVQVKLAGDGGLHFFRPGGVER